MANVQPSIAGITSGIRHLFHGFKPPKNNAGVYICLQCDLYPPDTNKIDWLKHTQQFHPREFAELVEIQKILTNACKHIKVDHDQPTSNEVSFHLIEENEQIPQAQTKEDAANQLFQLGEQYGNGSLNVDQYLKEANQLLEQVKKAEE